MSMMKKISNFARDLFRDIGGAIQVEFAFVAPILMMLCLGGFEAGRFILLNMKLDKGANTIADVVSQSSEIQTADIDDVYSAVNYMVLPYDFGDQGIVIVSSVSLDSGGVPIVNWQYSGAGTLAGHPSKIGIEGETATLPDNFTLGSKENVIIAEVMYNYSPLTMPYIDPEDAIYKIAIYRPRLGALETLDGAS